MQPRLHDADDRQQGNEVPEQADKNKREAAARGKSRNAGGQQRSGFSINLGS